MTFNKSRFALSADRLKIFIAIRQTLKIGFGLEKFIFVSYNKLSLKIYDKTKI